MNPDSRPISKTMMTMAAIGLGSYWAWMNLMAANATAFPFLAESLFPPQLVFSSFAYLCTMIALFFLSEKPAIISHMPVIVLACALAAFCGSLLIALDALHPGWLSLAGNILASVGAAGLLVNWGAFYCQGSQRQIILMTAGSYVFGTGAYLLLSEVLGSYLVYLLPVFMGLYGGLLVVFSLLEKTPSQSLLAEQASSSSRYMIGVLLCLCAFVLLNEILRIIATPLAIETFSNVGILTQFGGFLVSLVALISAIVIRRPVSIDTITLVLIPLMIAGFLSFLVFPSEESDGMFILLGSGYWFLNMLIWMALCNLVQNKNLIPIKSFSLFYGTMQLTILIAKPVGNWLLNHIHLTERGLSTVISFSIIVIVVLALILLHNKNISSLWNKSTTNNSQDTSRDINTDNSGMFASYLENLACQYKLTPRETEVFYLLARGRSLPVIKQELTIATGTAQTHIRHIYEKFNVHNRQELIDIIEGKLQS